jgi:uncharacterized membrane protein
MAVEVAVADTAPRPGRVRHYLHRFSYLGLVGAVLGFLAAMTPSLLPRPPLFQGLIAGIGVAFGYGVGTLTSWVVRRVGTPEPPAAVKRVAWRVLAVAGPVAFLVILVAGGIWQNDVRELVDEPTEPTLVLAVVVIAPLFALLILTAARGIRRVTVWVDRQFARVVPRWLAKVLGLVAVVLVLYWLAAGVLFNALVNVADSAYAGTNATTAPGVVRPTSPERSGSPASLATWDSLGQQGRSFVGSGPDPQQLQAFSGRPANEPIRVYVGLDTASTARDRADLAVRELERAGAFDRSVLGVAGTTGTGWLEPQTMDALEYLWNGDTAIVGIQYSYLPSWISFLVDKDRASDAGSALFDAVYARWSELPQDHRPKLIAYGLSLGSFSMQSAFGSAADLASRTDGALFVGTPDFTEPWGDITSGRDPGSPEWQPVYQGGDVVRFGTDAADLERLGDSWDAPRVAYLQHASDPVVWWSPDLLTRQPDWLAEPRGPDVSPQTRWYPFVTFVQVTVDQFFGTAVPNGHGHNYPSAIVGAWQAVVPAPDVSPAQAAELQARIDAMPTE